VVTAHGTEVLPMAKKYEPDGITLDIGLRNVDGWIVLDRLKHDSAVRHIPVHVITGDEDFHRGMRMGAVAYLQKPATEDALQEVMAKLKGYAEQEVKNLLVVEDDDTQRKVTVELIGGKDVNTVAVGSGEEALKALQSGNYDCMVLDLRLPDMTGFDLIDKMAKDLGIKDLPVIVYTGKDLTREEETQLKKVTETIIVKDANSADRLLDETALFLHRVEAKMPENKRKILEKAHQEDPVLQGKKVLIVDDDVRNIFAVTSLLESHGMKVVYTEGGKAAIELLDTTSDVDIVLMDIMMPEMDGYETMGEIRKRENLKSLPIIALTAKAMKGDREKCIEAGASDYITKPVDSPQLLSLLRVWLYK